MARVLDDKGHLFADGHVLSEGFIETGEGVKYFLLYRFLEELGD